MDEAQPPWRELGLIELIDMIWAGRVMIVFAALVCVAAGTALYFLVQPRYQATVEISSLTGAKFADYAGLVAATRTPAEVAAMANEATSDRPGTPILFSYTRDSLLAEYAKYITDADRLTAVSEETGAGIRSSDARFALNLPKEGQTVQEEPYSIRMTVGSDDAAQLDAFVAAALKRASRDLAQGLRTEIEDKLAAGDATRAEEARKLEVQIAGRRQRQKAERADTIEKLSAEGSVARSIGLDKPIELLAQTLTVARMPAPSTIVTPAPGAAGGSNAFTQEPAAAEPEQPGYFDGYLAIEENLNQLRSRADDDAFIPDLRKIEERLYGLQNDPSTEHVEELLKASMLNEPDTAEVVSYSLVAAQPRKVFPTPGIFAAASLGIGLILGACLAIYKGVKRRRRLNNAALDPAVNA